MNIALWVLQVVLALAFLVAGMLKLTQPKEKLRERLAYVEDFAEPTIKLIGALEILAAIGLILPPLTGIAPWLAPTAAAGLVVIMVGAVVVHARRKEIDQVALPAVLGLAAAVVAWGRFGPEPF